MIVQSTLMCHAPIVIPKIGVDRAIECKASTMAMMKAGESIVASKPDRLIVLSPHTLRALNNFSLVGGNKIAGNFGNFGFPEIGISLPGSETILGEFSNIKTLPKMELDHGALVPLYFIQEAGWDGPTMVAGYPYDPTHEECQIFGSRIRTVSNRLNEKWAICASGDMSHRLFLDAPAGFHPKAKDFDEWVTENVKKGQYQTAIDISEDLRSLAAEDVIDSLEISSAATEFSSKGSKFFSYEGPFGVGYLVATLYSDNLENL